MSRLLACLLARCVLLASALQQGSRHGLWGGGENAGAAQRAGNLGALGASGSRGGGDDGGGSLSYEHKAMEDLVVGAGYPLEEHFVTTEDGYVLGLYHIPHGRSSSDGGGTGGTRQQRRSRTLKAASGASAASSASSRPCVLLQHGLLDSSAAWVLNEPQQSLGFILADAGYCVWLGNSRGNAFSRNHTGLDPGRAPFWDFSWDDMAAYDMPAVVDYILQRCDSGSGGSSSSGRNAGGQLAYVGHSQGTTQMFAALSSSPALRARLSLAIMLAPAVHMRHIQALPLQVLAAMDADKLFNLLGAYEFLPSRQAAADLFGQLCTQTPLACASIITAICGFNSDNMNLTRLPTMVQYAPSGTSVKNIAHWAQAIRKSRQRERPLFQMYDYGDVCVTPSGLPHNCNMRMYHALEPPSYDLAAIDTPLAIFHGGQDRLAAPADVQTLLDALSAASVVYTQLEPSYEHIDFTWGIDAQARIYPAVLRLLQQYHGSGGAHGGGGGAS